MKNIIFIAPPAAGKGTQSSLIEEYYNIPHISIGDLLRNMISDNTEESEEIKELINKGELVDDEIVIDLLKKRIVQKDCSKGYILDGFPRNINQAKSYEKLLNELDLPKSLVIFLDLDREIAEKRVIGRVICPNCQNVYNEYFKETSPINAGLCDDCHVSLIKRSDDNKITFYERYDTYYEETKPVIDYYTEKGNLVTIDATLSKNEIFDKIKLVLGE